MRCPKCSAKFRVFPDGNVDPEGSAPADVGPPKLAVPKPSAVLGGRDDGGTDLPQAKPRTMLGIAGGADLPAPKIDTPKRPPPPGAGLLDDVTTEGSVVVPKGDLDLPAPKVEASKRPNAQVPNPGEGGDESSFADLADELDLPAPKTEPAPAPSVLGGGTPSQQNLKATAPFLGRAVKAKRVAPPGFSDLPAPRKRVARRPPSFGALVVDSAQAKGNEGTDGTDLPAPKGAGSTADLPAPFERDDATDKFEVSDPFETDLPARKGVSDLPAPRNRTRIGAGPSSLSDSAPNPFDELDLPAPKPGRKAATVISDPFGDLELPMPNAAAKPDVGFGDLDLPAPAASVDLPTPRAGSSAPAADRSSIAPSDFPLVQDDLGAIPLDDFEELDLPSPRNLTDLPGVRADDGELPSLKGGTDLPMPRVSDLPLPDGESEGGAFDDLALPEPAAFDGVSDGPAAPTDADGRTGLGGTAFGEIDFGEGEDGDGDGDDMEFALPQEAPTAEGAPAPAAKAAAQRQKSKAKVKQARQRRATLLMSAGAAVAAVLLVGVGLGFTSYGFFGMYLLDPLMPGAGDAGQVRSAIQQAEAVAASDQFGDARASLRTLDGARRNAGLNRPLLGRSLMHHALFQVRFGAQGSEVSRVGAIRNRLVERGAADRDDVALGLAADELRLGRLGQAQQYLGVARRFAAGDPYVQLIAAELAMAQGDTERALESFQQAADAGASARGLWGVARVHLAGEDAEAARAAVDAVLEASPRHGGALAERSRMALDAGELDEALSLAERVLGTQEVDGERLRSAPNERALALVVRGQVQESRGLTNQALMSYEAATEVDGSYVPALIGSGRVLLEDRPSDALARFESVLQSEGAEGSTVPGGRSAADEASLGRARALLALDRTPEARAALSQLAARRPDDADVLLWLGKSDERIAQPDLEAAEEHYRTAIQIAPNRFEPYLALSELFLQQGRGEDAGEVLDNAAEQVEETAGTRYQRGRFELRRREYDLAIQELTRALELAPNLPTALFSLGVAYRYAGRLRDAQRVLDRLTAIEADHPGLAMERGRLHESRGQSAEAVAAYRAALEHDPGNMDLELRLAIALVASRQLDEAERTLDRIRDARPGDAEAQHFTGRVSFLRGNNEEALRYFRQAVRLSPDRPEFHYYAARAAVELGPRQLPEALREAEAAIALDEGYASAYSLRGAVRLEQGLPGNAIEDLQRALTIDSSDVQARAWLGDALVELGRRREAIRVYESVVENIEDNGFYAYRLGMLRMDIGARAQAATALQRSVSLAEDLDPAPYWVADAHRLLGNAMRLGGSTGAAIRHYQRYLELTESDALDRPEVIGALRELGVDAGPRPLEIPL